MNVRCVTIMPENGGEDRAMLGAMFPHLAGINLKLI
jgi:hypothetical protein